jgi:hypothetical protein
MSTSLVKIFTVTRDDADIIEDFILYYGTIFGYSNVVIIDNNSCDPTVLAIYDKYRNRGVIFETCPSYKDGGQGDAFTTVMHKYKTECEFLVGLDSDEFLYIDGSTDPATSLPNYFQQLPTDATIFSIPTTNYLYNKIDTENPHYINFEMQQPIRNITTFKHTVNPAIIKRFYRSNAFVSTSNGNHRGVVSHGREHLVDAIRCLHYHNRGNRTNIDRSAIVCAGYNYVDLSRHYVDQMLQLAAHSDNCNGFHRLRHYKYSLLRRFIIHMYIIWNQRLPTLDELNRESIMGLIYNLNLNQLITSFHVRNPRHIPNLIDLLHPDYIGNRNISSSPPEFAPLDQIQQLYYYEYTNDDISFDSRDYRSPSYTIMNIDVVQQYLNQLV